MLPNYPLLDEVATWLEAGAPHEQARGMGFDMADFIVLPTRDQLTNPNWCGTSCCIAGAAITFGAPELVATLGISERYSRPGYATGGWKEARKLLGLTEDQSDRLFAPWNEDPPKWGNAGQWPREDEDIDAAWAARTIRFLIATGEVRWDLTKEVADA